jgi:hypothetical protein
MLSAKIQNVGCHFQSASIMKNWFNSQKIYPLITSLNQAVHVAAQYGQTAFLNHIISKYGVDFDALDGDGRSPLHWYAELFSLVCEMN